MSSSQVDLCECVFTRDLHLTHRATFVSLNASASPLSSDSLLPSDLQSLNQLAKLLVGLIGIHSIN